MSAADNVWNRFKEQIQDRMNRDHPPYRNVIVVHEGTDQVDLFVVPEGSADGLLQLIIGPDSISASFSWTIQVNDPS